MNYWYFTKEKPQEPVETFLKDFQPFLEADKGNFAPLKELHFAAPVRDIVFRRGGWAFDPRPNLKEYWVKFSWGSYGDVQISTWHALNKGDIRRNFMRRYGISPRHIIRILEVPNAR